MFCGRWDTKRPAGRCWAVETIHLLKCFAPEIIDLLERRYNILRTVQMHQPIGRRLLAEKLGVGERVIRSEIELLKENQILAPDSSGVYLTPESEQNLVGLGNLVHELRGLSQLEKWLKGRLGLQKVMIVPGDLDKDPGVIKELGRLAGRFIVETVQNGWVAAVTGGTTMSEVALSLPRSALHSRTLVVPGRGGFGEDVEIQANTVAAAIAQKLGASYRLLHIPDNVASETLEDLLADHKIAEVIALSKRADIFIHGIGVPREMSLKRDLNWQQILHESTEQPVGEALGNYFALDGQVVTTTPTVGPKLADLANMQLVVAIAGGSKKGKAILAVSRNGLDDVLITDEGAARIIQEELGN